MRLAAPLLLALHLVLVYAMAWQEHVHVGALNDFGTYIAAARTYAGGQSPYDAAALLAHSPFGPELPLFPFVYPPPFLALTAWIPATDPQTAFALWFVVNEVLTLVGTLLFARACGPRIPAWAWALALVASASVPNQLAAGQAGGLLFALLGAACWAASRNRAVATGAVLGVSLALKPMLLPSLVLLAIAKRTARLPLAAVLAYAAAHLIWLAAQAAPGLPGTDLGLALIDQFHATVFPTLPGGSFLDRFLPLDVFVNLSIQSLIVHHGVLVGAGAALTCAALLPAALLVLAAAVRPNAPGLAPAAALLPLLAGTFVFEHHLLFGVPTLALAAAALASPRGTAPLARWTHRTLAAAALVSSVPTIEWLRHLWAQAQPPAKALIYDARTGTLLALAALVFLALCSPASDSEAT